MTKTLSRKPYMLMLKDDSGEIEAVKLDTSMVNSDNAIIVLDEYNDTTWVFIGRNVNMPTRMHALRMGKSIQKSGYKIGVTTIGLALTNLVEMLEKNDSDAEVAENISSFRSTIDGRWSFDDGVLACKEGAAAPTAAAPMKPPTPPAREEPLTLTAETVTPAAKPTPPVPETPKSLPEAASGIAEKKAAFLLYSAVKNSDLIYTERIERDGQTGMKIEAPGTMVIEVLMSGDNISVTPSEFGDTEGAKKIKSDFETWLGKL